MKCPGSVWEIACQYRGDSLKAQHDGTFPGEIPARLIQCFSRPGDLILDPYSGSGTTCLEADRLGREWCGFDIAEEYTALAERRLAARRQQPALEFAA
jgi:DNA modification methylase